MAPTIVTDRGKPFIAIGSPGGSTIPPAVLQVLVDRLDLGATLPAALARRAASSATRPAPRPSRPSSPPRWGRPSRAQYGHMFTPMAEIGAVTALEFGRHGRVLAAAEPTRRGGGSAAVVHP